MDDHRTYAAPPSFPVAKPYQAPPVPVSTAGETPGLQLVLVPSGLTLDLKQPEQVLGRHSTSDIRLPLADVSRRHCKVFYASSCWHIVDLDSTNGIFVNHRRVHQTKLTTGDLLRIGS